MVQQVKVSQSVLLRQHEDWNFPHLTRLRVQLVHSQTTFHVLAHYLVSVAVEKDLLHTSLLWVCLSWRNKGNELVQRFVFGLSKLPTTKNASFVSGVIDWKMRMALDSIGVVKMVYF